MMSSNMRHCVEILAIGAVYYPLSVGLTFYQKWFIKDFKFPLTVVCLHYGLKFVAIYAIRQCYTYKTGKPRVLLEWGDFLLRIAPVGIAASIDIGLSNWAFEYITISLYTMAKSSCIIFILLFGAMLGLERCGVANLSVVFLISGGLLLFTYKSTQFEFVGFMLVELAAACGGIRWALSQFLMRKEDLGLQHPIDMIYHVQPWMMVGVLPLAFAFEGDRLSVSSSVFEYSDVHLPIRIAGMVLIGGTMALVMEIAEYWLLVKTSIITLQIIGIIKELCTLLLAHIVNNDQFSTLNAMGLSLCVFGISLHVAIKAQRQQPIAVDKHQTVRYSRLDATADCPSDEENSVFDTATEMENTT